MSQRRWAQAKCAVLVVIFVLVALFLTGCEGEGGAYCSGEGVGHQDIHGHVEPWLKAIMDYHAGELGTVRALLRWRGTMLPMVLSKAPIY